MSSFPPPPPEPFQGHDDDPPALGTVICEVTGKQVPEDETVVFQGRRVSAEGKQILADRLNAGETMPGELENASHLARLGAAILDSLVVGVAGVVLGLAIGLAGASVLQDPDLAVRLNAVGGILGGLLGMAYYGLMHANGGQTLGKMAAKSRVVTRDGGKITAGTAWLRAAIFSLPGALGQLPLLILGFSATAVQLAEIVAVVVGVFGLINILLIFRASKKCLHDDLAGTRVVTTRA